MTKSRSKKATKKVEEALANPQPIAALGQEEFIFAFHMAMGKTAVGALREAKPEWSKETVEANAYLWKKRPDIVRAMQAMQEKFAEQRMDTVIMSKTEMAMMLTAGARATLAEIDEHSPFCTEKRRVVNAAGVTEWIKKDSPVTYIKELRALLYGDEDGQPKHNLTKDEILKSLRRPGLPKENGVLIDNAIEILDADDD